MSSKLYSPKKILVIRFDRIGDVVLSEPVLEVLSEEYSEAEIHFCIQKSIWPLLENQAKFKRFVYEPYHRHQGFSGLLRLVKEIKSMGFDACVSLQSNPRLSLACFLAQIPIRVGPYSKFHSYLFYNSGKKQSRSESLKHELEYNLDLLTPFGIHGRTKEDIQPTLYIQDQARELARLWMESEGLDSEKLFLLVHPGMGGSAKNWSMKRYLEFFKLCAEAEIPTVLSFGPMDQNEEEVYRKHTKEMGGEFYYYSSKKEKFEVDVFAALCEKSRLVLAPSTGPLHIATASGCDVISLYPPIRVQSERRWGPVPKRGKSAKVFVPDSSSEQEAKSTKDIMDRVSAQTIMEEVRRTF